jgi:hypothetical protein
MKIANFYKHNIRFQYVTILFVPFPSYVFNFFSSVREEYVF